MSDNRGSNSIDVSVLSLLLQNHLISFQSQLSVSEATPVEEENEHTIYSKARFERCLRDRWRCKVKGHSYCFKDGESAHIQLMEDHLKQWANICVGTDHSHYEMLVNDCPLAQWLRNYPRSAREHHIVIFTPPRLRDRIHSLQ